MADHPSRGPEPTLEKVAKTIDHSVLQPEARIAAVEEACAVALEYNVASVCCKPADIARVAARLRGSAVAAGTVIGFPHGGHAAAVKAREAEVALADGARELDMVINIGWLKSGMVAEVHDEIAAVVGVARQAGALVKVIIEAAYLADDEKRRACRLAEEAGANYVKTSTGYAPKGATVADVMLMRAAVSPAVGITASGGIRGLDDVLKLIAAGATRIGTSSTAAVLDALRQRRSG